MKSSLEVLAALKIEYAKTLLEPPIERIGLDCFDLYLTDEFIINASIDDEVALITISREVSNKEGGEKKQFTEVMNKIFGFPPYCSYKNRREILTLIWIEKDQELHFESLRKALFPLYNLTKL
jgi:hypothetical protein